MFGQLLFTPLGDSLTLEDFAAPSPVELRRVFPTAVCMKMFGEELGPGNEPCEGWNQPVVLETPSLEPPVGNKCNCHEWEELIPEFNADFDRVHKLDGGRMELAREAAAVRATGEARAIHALLSSHNKFGKVLTELQLFLMSQNRKACKRIAGGGKTSKGRSRRVSAPPQLLQLGSKRPRGPAARIRGRGDFDADHGFAFDGVGRPAH
jgi:hypothetical protein